MNERFDRQIRFQPFGPQGQERIAQCRVLLVGCGALGGVLAQNLTRAGVGELVLVDRDFVEESNLARQVLFEDEHARDGTLKVEAARATLARIGGPTRFACHAEHLDADNIAQLADGVDLVLDGTDNLGTRYLINDFCVERNLPWVYGGVVGGAGLCLAVRPQHGACLRCVFRDPPPAGVLPTCDTAGVLAPAVGVVASMQAGLALRLLVAPDSLRAALIELDAWNGEVRQVNVGRDPQCPTCALGEFPFLHEPVTDRGVVLCGRNTVQVRGSGTRPDLDALVRQLSDCTENLQRQGPLLRFDVESVRFTVFADGRALIEGTDEAERAIALYERYISS